MALMLASNHSFKEGAIYSGFVWALSCYSTIAKKVTLPALDSFLGE